MSYKMHMKKKYALAQQSSRIYQEASKLTIRINSRILDHRSYSQEMEVRVVMYLRKTRTAKVLY
jgi:hypothetical protein